MAAKPAYALYNYARSSCSWRARIALEWKGLPYEYVVVDVLGGQQLRDEYAALNPNKRVPLLALGDGRVVAQSSAILEYLEEAHPELPALLPPLSEPFARAQVRNLCGIICSDTQPLQSLGVQAKATEHLPESERAAAKAEWMRYWIARGLGAVEEEIAATAGAYCLGDRVTLADVYLLPQVGNARLAGLDMGAFPIIARVVAALEELPAFARSRPEAQPDAK